MRKKIKLSKEMLTVATAIVERSGGFEHKMTHRSTSPEDRVKLAEIAKNADCDVRYLVRCVRIAKGVKVATRRNANGDRPGQVNYCGQCGTHIAKVLTVCKEVNYCPMCGRKQAS